MRKRNSSLIQCKSIDRLPPSRLLELFYKDEKDSEELSQTKMRTSFQDLMEALEDFQEMHEMDRWRPQRLGTRVQGFVAQRSPEALRTFNDF